MVPLTPLIFLLFRIHPTLNQSDCHRPQTWMCPLLLTSSQHLPADHQIKSQILFNLYYSLNFYLIIIARIYARVIKDPVLSALMALN